MTPDLLQVTVRLENGAFTHTLRLLKKANISADGLFDGSDPGAVAAFKNLGAACVEFVSKKYMGRSNPRLPNPQQLQVTWHAQAGKHSAYAALLASVRVCVQVDGSEEEETGLVLLNFNVGEAVAKNASEAEKAAAHARAVAKVTAGLSYLNLDLPVDNETFFMLWDFILGARGTSPLARVTMSVIEGAPCVFEKTHVYEDGTTKSFFVVHVAHRPRHWYGGTYSELSTARWVAALMALTRVGITTGHFTFEKLQNCGAIGATLTDLQVGHLFPQTKAFKALVEDTKSLTPVAVQAAMEGWAAAGVQLPAFRLYPDNRSTWEPPTAGQGGSPGAAAAGAGFGSSCTAASSSSAAAGGAASAASHSDAAGTTELNGTGAAWEPDVGGACSAADEDARSSLACSSAGAGRASGAILAAVSDASWSSARASAEVDGAAAVAAPPPSAPFGGPPSAEAVDPVERAVREMLPGATVSAHGVRDSTTPLGSRPTARLRSYVWRTQRRWPPATPTRLPNPHPCTRCIPCLPQSAARGAHEVCGVALRSFLYRADQPLRPPKSAGTDRDLVLHAASRPSALQAPIRVGCGRWGRRLRSGSCQWWERGNRGWDRSRCAVGGLREVHGCTTCSRSWCPRQASLAALDGPLPLAGLLQFEACNTCAGVVAKIAANTCEICENIRAYSILTSFLRLSWKACSI